MNANNLIVNLLRRFYPTTGMPERLRGDEAVTWTERARKYERRMTFALLPLMLLFTGIILWLIDRLVAAAHSLSDPARFDVRAHLLYYALPALLLGILVAGIAVFAMLRLRLGADDYARYQWASSVNAGYDSRREMRLMLLVVAVPTGLAIALLADSRFRLNSDSVERNRFLTIGTQRRALSEIRAVYLVRHHNRKSERNRIAIVFADGSRWDTAMFDSFPNFDATRALSVIENEWKIPVQRLAADAREKASDGR